MRKYTIRPSSVVEARILVRVRHVTSASVAALFASVHDVIDAICGMRQMRLQQMSLNLSTDGRQEFLQIQVKQDL